MRGKSLMIADEALKLMLIQNQREIEL